MPNYAGDFRGQGPNAGNGIVLADAFQTTLGVSVPKAVLSGTITFDPPSLTTGAFALSAAIPIVGIALGDSIDLYPPYDTQGIAYQASPSSAGNMTIGLRSNAAGTVDLISGSWGYVVKRRT